MKTIGVISGIEIGRWRMPQKAQTCLVQQYASQSGFSIDIIFSDYVFSKDFSYIIYTIKSLSIERAVFVSAYQLPKAPEQARRAMAEMDHLTVCFALEDMIVAPQQPYDGLLQELAIFRSIPSLSAREVADRKDLS